MAAIQFCELFSNGSNESLPPLPNQVLWYPWSGSGCQMLYL